AAAPPPLEGGAGRDPEVRACPADRECQLGHPPDLAVSTRQARFGAPGPRSASGVQSAQGPPRARRVPVRNTQEPDLRRMNDHTLFLGKFLTQLPRGNPIATIAPSS